MEPSDLIVLTPPGVADPSVAIAACRAGARGTLNLTFGFDASALARLARFAGHRFGVKLGHRANDSLPQITGDHKPAWVILSGCDSPDLAEAVRSFQNEGVE